jgi:hypothetical protein
MNSKKISQTFGGRAEWNIGGAGYFKLLSSVTPVDVELWSSAGPVLDAPDAEAGFYLRAPFDRVVITTPVSQAVSWLFSPAEGGSDRLAGEVSIVEGGRSRTLAGIAYISFATAAASPGNQSSVQLWNVSVDKRLVLTRLTLGTNTAQTLQLRRASVALATLAMAAERKLFGTGTSVSGQAKTENPAAAAGAIVSTVLMPANTPFNVPFSEPLILEPAAGLTISGTTVNTSVNASFDHWEEDDV